MMKFIGRRMRMKSLQHTRMRQSRHNDEQYAYYNDRRTAEARECLLCIEHSRHEEYGNCSEEHEVGTQFREEQHAEHGQHRGDGYPRMEAKALEEKCIH